MIRQRAFFEPQAARAALLGRRRGRRLGLPGRLPRQQTLYPFDELRRRDPARQACPLHLAEPIRYSCITSRESSMTTGTRKAGRHHSASDRRPAPFETEVSLARDLRGLRDDRNKRAGLDLLADLWSQASPPRSSLWSNQTSIPAARSASQILWAASASCEA